MNKLAYKLFIVFFVFFSFTACKKNEKENAAGTGKLVLNLKNSNNDKIIIKTVKSVPLNDYFVSIYHSNGNIFAEYPHFSDVPDEIILETGDYYVIANSANDSAAAFENPYYYGQSETFSIGSDITSNIDIICSIVNCAATVIYSTEVTRTFVNYYTVISNAEDSLHYISTEDKTGFFHIALLNIKSVLLYELSDGSFASKVLNSSIDNPLPGNLYEITVDATIGNQQTGIGISNISTMDTSQIEMNNYIRINDLNQGDILITEIMYDPSALTDTDGEWFEIYNNSGEYVNLQGLVLRRGTSYHAVGSRIILAPGEYYGMAREDTAFEGNKYIYSGITFTNTTDEITLLTAQSGGIVIASVVYDEGNGFPLAAGESINLSPPHFDFNEAQTGSSWCLSTEVFNTGDYGTPGSENTQCE